MRRLVALAQGLGPTSRSAWGIHGGWGPTEHLLAGISDRLERIRYAIYNASPVEFDHEPEMVFVQRPNQRAAQSGGMSVREFFAMTSEGDGAGG